MSVFWGKGHSFRFFKKVFSSNNLKETFQEYVAYSGATGVDKLNPKNFSINLEDQVSILSRKSIAGTYNFSNYKLKLISKGRGKIPREISIPTVRDRIALRALNDFLGKVFEKELAFDLPQNVIRDVKNTVISGEHDGVIKLDVANFYPSIVHQELMLRIRQKIRNEKILDLIKSAIESPTVVSSDNSPKKLKVGVPQGLSVSNTLAALYLINVDKKYLDKVNIKYFRYVDDILIFCNFKEAKKIARDVIKTFSKIGLDIYDPSDPSDKSSIVPINHEFGYLGYRFCNGTVTARQATIEKLKDSLASIFTAYKYSKGRSKEYLEWRLNLRITGCIFENKSKGWIFFFAEITDESLLHALDHYVTKLTKRFNVNISPKKFVRAYKEISYNRYETKYIPNFDDYIYEKKEKILSIYFRVDTSMMSKSEVEFEFHKRIGNQVKDLLLDIKDFRS